MSVICFIGKYPPIQGGTSASTYWHLEELARRGHQIHIVSNSWDVEEEYRHYLTGDDLDFIKDHSFASGGYVKHHFINPFFEPHFIPANHPFITKLSSKAIEVITKFSCEKIYAYYLEPYAIVAFIASQITKIPFYVRHAGSDITRLYDNPEFNFCYKNILNFAKGIITNKKTADKILDIINDPQKIKIINSDFLPNEYFNPNGNKLNLNELFSNIDEYIKIYKLFNWNNDNFDSNKINFGIYCKASPSKGIFEIIKSLNLIENISSKINLIFMTGGKNLKKIQDAVLKSQIKESTYFVPFLPPWRVPSFLRMCDVIFDLENNFSVPIHGPRIPREILSCGRCMFISDELLNKQIFSHDIKHRNNAIVISTPININDLSSEIDFIINNRNVLEKIKINTNLICSKYNFFSPDTFINEFKSALDLNDN